MLGTQLIIQAANVVVGLFTVMIFFVIHIICGTENEVVMKSEEDVVYGGNTAKWAKFANSLKLRIAVRLLAQNESIGCLSCDVA